MHPGKMNEDNSDPADVRLAVLFAQQKRLSSRAREDFFSRLVQDKKEGASVRGARAAGRPQGLAEAWSLASEVTTEVSAVPRSDASSLAPSLSSAAAGEGLRSRRSTASERRVLQKSVAVVSRLYDELLLLSLRHPKLGEAAASLLQELAGPGVSAQAEDLMVAALSRCVQEVRRLRLSGEEGAADVHGDGGQELLAKAAEAEVPATSGWCTQS
mmetsp:Transcript_9560/g.17752  ORF Transcript_9560/g.17752 Transcript_9560/m.17752 type:complete len:214 (-) Transcript_9560:59-700(-)